MRLPDVGNLIAAVTYAAAGLLCVPVGLRNSHGNLPAGTIFLAWSLSYAGCLAVGIFRLRPGDSVTLFRILSGIALVQAWIYLLFWGRLAFQGGDPGGEVAVGAFFAGPMLATLAATYTRRPFWFTLAQAGGPASILMAGILFG